MTTSCQPTYHAASTSPFRRALQSDLDAAFAAAFRRLRRAACKLARRQERCPRTGKLIGPVAELCRLAIAASEVTDVCKDWLFFWPFGIKPPAVDPMKMSGGDYRLALAAWEFVGATRAMRDGKPVERDVINRKHDELIEAALGVGCER